MPERAGRPFLILAVAFFTLLLGSNLPTPLYAVYRELFGFSGIVLTLVFATYMLVLVPTLLLCGQLSDRVGRKRVVAAGLLTAATRGEVTAAFISCIYSGVAISAIGVGLLSTALSLRAAVTIFAIAVGSTALTAIAWHLSARIRAPQAAR